MSTIKTICRRNPRRFALLILLSTTVGLAGACSSAPQANLIDPAITIRDIDGVIPPNQMISAPIDLTISVEIKNRSGEPFTLKRVTIQSVGSGAFRVSNETRQFTDVIASGGAATIRMPLRAYATAQASSNPMLPLTLRGMAIFDTPLGEKRSVFVENLTLSNTLRTN